MVFQTFHFHFYLTKVFFYCFLLQLFSLIVFYLHTIQCAPCPCPCCAGEGPIIMLYVPCVYNWWQMRSGLHWLISSKALTKTLRIWSVERILKVLHFWQSAICFSGLSTVPPVQGSSGGCSSDLYHPLQAQRSAFGTSQIFFTFCFAVFILLHQVSILFHWS